MARLTVAACLLAAALCAAVAAAADPKLMVTDFAVSSKSSKARTSSYYDNTELACLNQQNFKNCRYTGCPVDRTFEDCEDTTNTDCRQCAPDSIYFQTDFTCCNKEHSYYYGSDTHHDIGLAFNDKVGTCDWEISMYRVSAMLGHAEPPVDPIEPVLPYVDPYAPHYTDDGTAIKFGTAWGTCYLNAEAEHCGHPLCERMAINIQGGLYATCSYSTDTTAVSASALDTCASPGAGASFNDFDLAYLFGYLMNTSTPLLAPNCFGAAGGSRRLQSADAKTDDYNSHQTHTYYPGIALVLSGPMHVTAKKDHKLEETGMYEQTLSFLPYGTAPLTGTTDPTNHWPVVNAKGTKIRFTREQEEYYQGGSQ